MARVEPRKPVKVMQTLEGAAALMKLARNIDDALDKTKEVFVRVRRSELIAVASALKHSAKMIDRLVDAVEHGEKLSYGAPPVNPASKKPHA